MAGEKKLTPMMAQYMAMAVIQTFRKGGLDGVARGATMRKLHREVYLRATMEMFAFQPWHCEACGCRLHMKSDVNRRLPRSVFLRDAVRLPGVAHGGFGTSPTRSS